MIPVLVTLAALNVLMLIKIHSLSCTIKGDVVDALRDYLDDYGDDDDEEDEKEKQPTDPADWWKK